MAPYQGQLWSWDLTSQLPARGGGVWPQATCLSLSPGHPSSQVTLRPAASVISISVWGNCGSDGPGTGLLWVQSWSLLAKPSSNVRLV